MTLLDEFKSGESRTLESAINSGIGDKSEKSSEKNEKGSEKGSEKSSQKNEKSGQESDQKSNQKSDQKILELIAQNPKITIDDLMQSMSLSESGVKKILRALKAPNLIRRIGPDKGGHWEIVEK